jgi:putative ABC transport system permease protein
MPRASMAGDFAIKVPLEKRTSEVLFTLFVKRTSDVLFLFSYTVKMRPTVGVRCCLVVALVAGLLAVRGDARQEAPAAILVSRQLATARQLHVGAVIHVSASASGRDPRPFRIAGIYEPQPDPLRFAQARLEVRLHLPDLLNLTARPGDAESLPSVGAINVALTDPSRAAAFSRDVAARLPGIIARPVTAPDERTSTFIVIDRFHLAIAIVSVTGSAVFLLALMVMLVDERRETVGVLRLIGFTRRRILLQVVVEGALIAALGTACGVLVALVSQSAFNHFFQWKYDTSLIFLRVTPAVVLQSALLAVPLGIAASLLASWTFLRRRLLALVGR